MRLSTSQPPILRGFREHIGRIWSSECCHDVAAVHAM
jgi:hypothetical protein